MDHLSTEIDEFVFDDNGLQNAFLLASRQEIVPNDCVNENATEIFQLKTCDSFPKGRGDDERTEIAFDERKSYWTAPFGNEREHISFEVLPRTFGVTSDKESKQPVPNDDKDSKGSTDHEDRPILDLTVGHIIKKEGPENEDGRSPIGWEPGEDKNTQFRSGGSPKDAGCSQTITDLEVLSSLTSFLATSFVTIFWQLSISLTVGIILSMPSVGVEGALTTVPENTLVVVGKTVRINCSTDLNRPVYWARTLVGSDVQHWLYYGKNGFDGNNADNRFSIDKDETTGRYDVIIADVQPKDAGQYVCVDDSGIGARASAELVVSDPIKCNSRIPRDGVMGYNVFGLEQDFIQLRCSLTYTGNLSPTLEWNWPGSEVESDERVVSAKTSSVSSTIKLSPTKEHNNMKFQCKTNFEGATQHTINSGLLWESETVTVRYAEFAPKAVEVCPGVEWNLVCNPQCSYYLEGKAHDCQCRYTYYDKRTQQKYQVTSDAVRCGNDNNAHLVSLIAVASVAAISVTIVIILAFCLLKKTKGWPKDGSSESGQISNDNKSSEAMLNKMLIAVM